MTALLGEIFQRAQSQVAVAGFTEAETAVSPKFARPTLRAHKHVLSLTAAVLNPELAPVTALLGEILQRAQSQVAVAGFT